MDFSDIRTAQPPELIFLCGGNSDKEENTDKYLNYRPLLQKELENKGHKVVLAENAMDWQGGQAFAKDLLELEKYFAAFVSIIPLICESFGSATELGAFVNDVNIRNKLFIIIKEKFYSGAEASSFIRNGPIKNFEDNVGRSAYCISDENPENDIAALCKEITDCKPQTLICDFSKGYFIILLLMDIISILAVSEKKEIREKLSFALSKAADEEVVVENKQLDEMLFVLVKLELIRKRSKGSKKYFLATKSNYYLKYNYKNNAPTDANIANTKRQKIQEIYKRNTNDSKTKADILNEEKSKNEIKWLHVDSKFEKINIELLLKSAPLQYKVYKIAKRNGGTRTIAQPTPMLKELQRHKLMELESQFPVHECATAYVKNKNGILENATKHKNSKYFYKFDFKDFFPSIKANDFNKFLKKKKFNLVERIDYLKTFFRFDKESGRDNTSYIYRKFKDSNFNRNTNEELLALMTEEFEEEFQLSIGAPSSPLISNILMYDFDVYAHRWAHDNNFAYSRFADDITFSSNKKNDIDLVKSQLLEILKRIEFPKLNLNDSKQTFCSFKGQVRITGLNITPDNKISIGRKRKKEIRAMIHHYKLRKLSKEKIKKLQGWLSYCNAVEKGFVKSMRNKYSSELIDKIMKKRPKPTNSTN